MLAAMLFILVRTPKRVMPIPATPTNIPSGIPAMLTKNASESTHLRSCALVAPTEESSPNCFVRSFNEMTKEL